MRTSRGNRQGWILDRFLGGGALDTLFRGSMGFFLQMGYQYVDIEKAAASASSTGMLIKGFRQVGEAREAAGREAEAKGNLLTARNEYHRAAKCYARGQWAVFDDGEQKRALHGKCIECYAKVLEYNPTPIEKVEIAYADGKLFGYLHLPRGAGPHPCVLFCPGLDMIKEDFPNVELNILIERGMAVLSLDGPGHGESRLNGGQRWQIPAMCQDNYGGAATAAIDHLESRSEIDADRIGVFGISQGSYWGPVMCAADRRLKACAGLMGAFYEQGFDLGQPSFKENLMYMTGAESEEEVDEIIPYITVDGLEDKLHCALLMLHGEFDELTPESDARMFIDRAVNAKPKELTIYENEFHPCGGVAPEAFGKVADWMAHQLGAEPAGVA